MTLRALLCCLLLAGCGAESAPPPAAAPLRLTAVVEQDRFDATRHRMTVGITNGESQPVQVLQVQLRAPHFTVVDAAAAEEELAPGERTDFPVDYGTADCPGVGAAPASAQVLVRLGGGEPVRAEVSLDQSSGVLDRLRRQECDQRDIDARVTLDLDVSAPVTVSGHPALAGTLRLRGQPAPAGPRGTGVEVTLTALAGSVLFGVSAAPGGLPATLAAGQAEVAVPVVVDLLRCDSHALGQANKVFAFRATLRLGAGEPVTAGLAVPAELQPRLRALAERCPPGSG